MKKRRIAPIFILFYVLAGSVAAWKYQHAAGENIFDVQFCFGPLIENIVRNHTYSYGSFTAFRMPFIPFFLAGIAMIYNNLLFAYIVKNLIFFSILFASAYIVEKSIRHANRYILIFTAVYALSFPQFVLHAFSIDYGEGYLIALMAALFTGILRAREIRRARVFFALALINCAMALTNSNALPLSLGVCFFYFWVTGNRRVFLIFLSTLLVALAAWGLFNVRNSGKFTIFSSSNGLNFYKGNNELTLSFYPERSLDDLPLGKAEGLPLGTLTRPRDAGRPDEWERDGEYAKSALEFIKNHPLKEARLVSAKFYAMFLKLSNVTEDKGEGYLFLKRTGIAYMFVFRLLFFISVFFAARSILLKKCVISAIYIGFIILYSAPCLAGFAYERHVMPLVAITLFYLTRMYDII